MKKANDSESEARHVYSKKQRNKNYKHMMMSTLSLALLNVPLMLPTSMLSILKNVVK